MIAILNPYSFKGLLKSSNNAKFSRCRFSFNHWQNMVKINFQLGIAPCIAVDPQASYTARDAERILNTVGCIAFITRCGLGWLSNAFLAHGIGGFWSILLPHMGGGGLCCYILGDP